MQTRIHRIRTLLTHALLVSEEPWGARSLNQLQTPKNIEVRMMPMRRKPADIRLRVWGLFFFLGVCVCVYVFHLLEWTQLFQGTQDRGAVPCVAACSSLLMFYLSSIDSG